MRTPILIAFALAASLPVRAQRADPLAADIDRRTGLIAAKVAAWRHDIHAHPELSFQEERTAKPVADHLCALGLEVHTDVGGNGVVGILKGGKPGPVVALRADMDALPVVEMVDLPYKSTVRTAYNGQDVGVMHACGHDMHTAILMGTAEDGVLEHPRVDAVFGLHVGPGLLGSVRYTIGPTTAAADWFRIVVHGRQTHGAFPSSGVDPIVVESQIVLGFQTIVSRQVDLALAPAVVTVGAFNGGVRENIIPDSVVMIGTIRTYDEAMRTSIHQRMTRTATDIATSAGATAVVTIMHGYDVTRNDSALTNRMIPTLRRVAGDALVGEGRASAAGEDFSRFADRVPGFFLVLHGI